MSYSFNPTVTSAVKASDFNTIRTNLSTEQTTRSDQSYSALPAAAVSGTAALASQITNLRASTQNLVNYAGSNVYSWNESITSQTKLIRTLHLKEISQVVDDSNNIARCYGTCSATCGRGCSTIACRSACSTACSSACASGVCGTTCSGNCGASTCTGGCGTTCQNGCKNGCKNGCSGCNSSCTNASWTVGTDCGYGA